MNYNETTGIKVNKKDYDELCKKFNNKAVQWNSIWKVWQGKSPDWGGRWVGGWKGMKIQMYDKIPENIRDTKHKKYEGLPGEINPSINLESNVIHTTGNENIIRSDVRSLNETLINHFEPYEYSGTVTYTKKFLKSYKVELTKCDGGENVLETIELYTPSYETFKDEDVIKLYSDKDLTSYYNDLAINYTEENPFRRCHIKWTGDRFYDEKVVTVVGSTELASDISLYTESYASPRNNTSNNGSIMVNCNELGNNAYKLFNNLPSNNFFRKAEVNKPIIVEFSPKKLMILNSYTISVCSDEIKTMPLNWVVEASLDNRHWVNIDSFTMSEENWKSRTERQFKISSYAPYQYFRIKFLKSYTLAENIAMKIGNIKFEGKTVDKDVIVSYQPQQIGSTTTQDVASLGVKKYSETSPNPNDSGLMSHPSETSKVMYEEIENSNEKNQLNVYTFNENKNWDLKNENVIREQDHKEIDILLNKIGDCLNLKNGWFDYNDRCQISCQVNCQNRCQVSCQACNTKQCHDQKCGTH